MRTLIATCCLLAGAALAGPAGVTAHAGTPGIAAGAQSAAPLTDFSAARRKRHPPVAAPVAPAPPAWHGADPSYGPGTAQLRELQRRGICVIDEGYGRYRACNNE